LIKLFEDRGANVDYHDPHVPAIPGTRSYPQLAGRRAVVLTPKSVAAYDLVLIATDHDSVDYRMLAEHAGFIVDTRNACGQRGIKAKTIFKV
jgi:UDP-N-acetyl-D-glucosamine dehydrogenase